jgi:hypothetical protein
MKNFLAVLMTISLISASLVACVSGKTQVDQCGRCNCTNDNLIIKSQNNARIDGNSDVNLGNGYELAYSNFKEDSQEFVFNLRKDKRTECGIIIEGYDSNASCYCDKNGKPLVYINFDIYRTNASGLLPFLVQWEWL